MNQPIHRNNCKVSIDPRRISELLQRLVDRGYVHDDGAAWLTGGWVRYYKLDKAEHRKDYRGVSAPRIYSTGARGVQVEWSIRPRGEDFIETCTVRMWTVIS